MGDVSNIDIGWRSALMLSVCIPICFAAIFLLMRDIERRATIWLALFLLSAVFAVIPQIIGFAGFYQVWPGLTFAPFNTELFLGPLLFLHADRLMTEGPLGWKKWLLVPGALQIFYYTVAFVGLGDYQNKWAFDAAFHRPYVIPVETIFSLVLMVWALWSIRQKSKVYRVFLANTQSAALDFEPVWLSRLIWAVIPASLLYAGLEINAVLMPVSYNAAFPFQVGIMVFLAWLGFDALSRLHVPFPKMPEDGVAASPVITADRKTEKDWTAEGKALRESILQGEWFLEPRLAISDVAGRLATNESYISRAINLGLGTTFTAFINGLRVDHAKSLLSKTSMSVLEIALTSGFNSKATFNRVFKERENMTPSAFRTSQNP